MEIALPFLKIPITPILDLVRFYSSLRDYRVLLHRPPFSTLLVPPSTYLQYLPPFS